MLWLYDSRDRVHGKRKLHILPLTGEGHRKAWGIALNAEFPGVDEPDYRGDYQYLVDTDAEDPDVNDCALFNDYWAEYGWCLMAVDKDADIPRDAEVTPESEVKQ